ncbi:pyridoxamine 5'-phosphate oxidase family protein [Halogranum rubrum]|uniref:Flavin-nucleotide-binding protein n=1 Tax=Halogranum salarium B-1 TaxID=1210908 RepID=J3A2F3_9EURY|nr:pyridoxamine 5'-phosphate oxidase family protein [Halogranum salarium]EJN59503.1 hypothetical protein HSB1_16610 [Halogranum salarium B-1]
MRHIDYTYTAGMGDDEIDERLRSHEMGVLSLRQGDDALGLPVAHYYDGEQLYLRLCERPGGSKSDAVAATAAASFVVTGGETNEESWSIVLRGPLVAVDDELSDAVLNEWFAPIRLFDEAVEDVVPTVYRMEIRNVGGRRSCGPLTA